MYVGLGAKQRQAVHIADQQCEVWLIEVAYRDDRHRGGDRLNEDRYQGVGGLVRRRDLGELKRIGKVDDRHALRACLPAQLDELLRQVLGPAPDHQKDEVVPPAWRQPAQ